MLQECCTTVSETFYNIYTQCQYKHTSPQHTSHICKLRGMSTQNNIHLYVPGTHLSAGVVFVGFQSGVESM